MSIKSLIFLDNSAKKQGNKQKKTVLFTVGHENYLALKTTNYVYLKSTNSSVILYKLLTNILFTQLTLIDTDSFRCMMCCKLNMIQVLVILMSTI